MFEKYFQRFEELISPRNFSIQNLQKSKSSSKLGKRPGSNNENINNNSNNYFSEQHNNSQLDRVIKKYLPENENIFKQGAYLLNELNANQSIEPNELVKNSNNYNNSFNISNISKHFQ